MSHPCSGSFTGGLYELQSILLIDLNGHGFLLRNIFILGTRIDMRTRMSSLGGPFIPNNDNRFYWGSIIVWGIICGSTRNNGLSCAELTWGCCQAQGVYGCYNPSQVDRMWAIWGSCYNIPKAIFCLLKGTLGFKDFFSF